MGLATAAIVALLATSLPWSASIAVTARAADVTRRTWKIAPGVKLTRVKYANTPNEVRILTILPQRGPRLDVVAADSNFPMYRLTSGMAAANGAIAGVNGDFATRYGAPVHATMIDGELWNSATSGGTGFAVTHNGANAYVGTTRLEIEARPIGRRAKRIVEWNVGVPTTRTVHAYTRRGGTAVPPPGSSSPGASDPIFCAVRLGVDSAYDWANDQKTMITRTYKVLARDCDRRRMGLGSSAGNVVLASRSRSGSGSDWIKSLSRGTRIRLAYGFRGWPGVTDVVGGRPMLVRDGRNVAPGWTSGANHLLWFNPRTSVGINRACVDTDRTTACKVWVVTVDGRQGTWSKGMKLTRLAQEFQSLGAAFATNLDGGASTTMWVKRRRSAYCESTPPAGGCLVNRPSASFGERVTIDGLSLLPNPDGDTPSALR
jgi:hypothetical protein